MHKWLKVKSAVQAFFTAVNIFFFVESRPMLYLLTAIGLSPGGSTHLHTNSTQNNTNNYRTTQITTNVEDCRLCPVFARFTLAFALRLRKKHEKTSVRLSKTSVRIQYAYNQNTHTLQNSHKHTHYKTHTYTHTHTHTHTHITM
jgi:hypothetical protein